MHYKTNNSFLSDFSRLFILVVSVSILIVVIFPDFFGILFPQVLCIFFIMSLFIVLCIIFLLYLTKPITVSKKLLLIISFIIIIFLFANIILFLVKGLAQFTALELLTEPFPVLNVFYTLDGLNFTKLKYITLFSCLIKSLIFLLISILILRLNILINYKSSFSLNFDSLHMFLLISNLTLIFNLKSSFFYYFLRSFGFTFHGLSCEVLIHNYTFSIFFLEYFYILL
jgi:hypothetical protein